MKDVVIFILLFVLLVNCEKKSSEPQETPPKISSITYALDNSRASQALVTAANGGRVSATDQQGVQFEVIFPPHAIRTDQQITLTPLSNLTISGPNPEGCKNCNSSDQWCCHRGVWIEPSGLRLDSAITLNITFPADQFPFSDRGLIVHLNSTQTVYEAYLTLCDSTTYTLSTKLFHLSAYGTDDERYDRLEAEVYAAGENLNSHVGSDGMDFYDAANTMLNLHEVCSGGVRVGDPGYPDLVAEIERIMLDAWNRHSQIVRQRALQNNNCQSLSEIRSCINYLDRPGISGGSFQGYSSFQNHQDFLNLRASLLNDARTLLHSVAERGKQNCDEGKCTEGQELLECVINSIEALKLQEQEAQLLADATKWMFECCQWRGELHVTFTHVYIENHFSFHDLVSFEFNLEQTGNTVQGTCIGTHDISVVPMNECVLSNIYAPNFTGYVMGTIDSMYLDLTFIYPNPIENPANFYLLCDERVVPFEMYAPLESSIIAIHVHPHVLMQEGATDSGSGSENFGSSGPPIEFSWDIVIHSSTGN